MGLFDPRWPDVHAAMSIPVHLRNFTVFALACVILLGACTAPVGGTVTKTPELAGTEPVRQSTTTPFLPDPTQILPTEAQSEPKVWVSPAVPVKLLQDSQIPESVEFVEQPDQATWLLEIGSRETPESPASSRWVYALVAAFPTRLDGVTLAELKSAWKGDRPVDFSERPLLLTSQTKAALEFLWGPAGAGAVEVLPADQILDEAWKTPYGWAIVPFEELEPRWKVLRVEGQSPISKDFVSYEYPLTVVYRLTGPPPPEGFSLVASNRSADRMTVLVMTGTTALVRHTAARMEEMGIDYPALDVQHWLRSADITHISNEVPFYDECPPAIPVRAEMRFCSEPAYFQLLETVGADVIELTGNHILDWGPQAFLDTLEMYADAGLLTFGGGADLLEAVEPLVVEHNGNRLGFIGCNVAGPSNVWATDERPGATPCDFDEIFDTIDRFRRQGIVPIVTFQHFEVDEYKPVSSQRYDFERSAEAGAAIVSGSQAHFPQGMSFISESFVHYGLGNLFFDQMDMGRNRGFIDRHVFYGGRHISTELLTTVLEDQARPRPMTNEERREFLGIIFTESGWEVLADEPE